MDNMEKWKFLTLPGLEPRPLSRPARSQSLYRGQENVDLYIHFPIRLHGEVLN
jgi:hypothetical protein